MLPKGSRAWRLTAWQTAMDEGLVERLRTQVVSPVRTDLQACCRMSINAAGCRRAAVARQRVQQRAEELAEEDARRRFQVSQSC